MDAETDSLFEHSIYTVQARCVQMIRGRCEVLDTSGNQILWAELLPIIRVYESKSRRTEILILEGPGLGPRGECYDYSVLDCASNSRVGAFLGPRVRDFLFDFTLATTGDWALLGPDFQKMGYFKYVHELENLFQPTLTVRRGPGTVKFVGVPREGWHGYVNDVHACQIVKWDSITPRITVDCSADTQAKSDRRLVMAFVLIQMAIDVDRRTNTG